MDKKDVQNLKKRYLIWLYKTTKEAFDRYERKFTQLEIDEEILKEIEKELKEAYLPSEKKDLEKYVNDLRAYIDEKEDACAKLKYKGKRTNPEFIFLDVKLNAIEKEIKDQFGAKALEEIKGLYEAQMQGRILEERQEKQ